MQRSIFSLPVPSLVVLLTGCTNQSSTVSTAQSPSLTPTPAIIRAPLRPDKNVLAPSELAKWPWSHAQIDTPHRGVTHWLAKQSDGTTCDLLRFDFNANPRLQFELYSQDQDDAKPWDNVVDWWGMGVGPAIKHLNTSGSAKVVAAWNGPFFGYYHQKNPGRAFHLAPVVINGQLHHNRTNYRWTLGWNNTPSGPHLKMVHLANRAQLNQFQFASGTLQNLIQNGKLLRLQPFPQPGQAFARAPVPSTPQEVGHIPYFDHAKFSRASIAWSKDEKQLWMVFVREPLGDNEGQSINDLVSGAPQRGGWSVADLQRFWNYFLLQGKIWNAINSDAGDAGQLAYELPDGNYNLIPPRNASPFERRVFMPDFVGAPQGGALMYFFVREGANRPR